MCFCCWRPFYQQIVHEIVIVTIGGPAVESQDIQEHLGVCLGDAIAVSDTGKNIYCLDGSKQPIESVNTE